MLRTSPMFPPFYGCRVEIIQKDSTSLLDNTQISCRVCQIHSKQNRVLLRDTLGNEYEVMWNDTDTKASAIETALPPTYIENTSHDVDINRDNGSKIASMQPRFA